MSISALTMKCAPHKDSPRFEKPPQHTSRAPHKDAIKTPLLPMPFPHEKLSHIGQIMHPHAGHARLQQRQRLGSVLMHCRASTLPNCVCDPLVAPIASPLWLQLRQAGTVASIDLRHYVLCSV